MAELRDSVNACVRAVRQSGAGPAQMILCIKACAHAGTKRYPTTLREHDLSNADFMMDQIIKWAIIEYYNDA